MSRNCEPVVREAVGPWTTGPCHLVVKIGRKTSVQALFWIQSLQTPQKWKQHLWFHKKELFWELIFEGSVNGPWWTRPWSWFTAMNQEGLVHANKTALTWTTGLLVNLVHKSKGTIVSELCHNLQGVRSCVPGMEFCYKFTGSFWRGALGAWASAKSNIWELWNTCEENYCQHRSRVFLVIPWASGGTGVDGRNLWWLEFSQQWCFSLQAHADVCSIFSIQLIELVIIITVD